MVEEDDPVVLLEFRPDVPPHRLVAAEAVGEEHRLRGGRAVLDDVVALQGSQSPLTVTAQSSSGLAQQLFVARVRNRARLSLSRWNPIGAASPPADRPNRKDSSGIPASHLARTRH